MAKDPRAESDSDELPSARTAFETRDARPDTEAAEAAAVSRAAALLALVRPAQLSMTAYREVSEEARALLGVEPVEARDGERTFIEEGFESLGPTGRRAAEVLHTHARRRNAGDQAIFDFGLSPGERPVMQNLRASSEDERELIESEQSTAARDLFEPGTSTGALQRQSPATRLVAASLLDSDPLVQVAAAGAALRLDPANPLAEAILDEASRDQVDEIAELSRAILTTDRRAETRRIEVEHPQGAPDDAPDSALIHGTWARRGRWWRPDQDLHHYLCVQEALFPHLYRGPRPFEWSGYFSFRAWKPVKKDWHRQQAADSLAWWTHRKLLAPPDLIGHSYGGSLALLATQAEKELRGVVLLSPALHNTCLPDPSNYERILHVTTKLDLVLLADLSKPRLLKQLRDVTEWKIRRKGRLGHGATRDPRSWAASGLTDEVRQRWLPSLTRRP